MEFFIRYTTTNDVHREVAMMEYDTLPGGRDVPAIFDGIDAAKRNAKRLLDNPIVVMVRIVEVES